MTDNNNNERQGSNEIEEKHPLVLWCRCGVCGTYFVFKDDVKTKCSNPNCNWEKEG